jgi:hypothetical protein
MRDDLIAAFDTSVEDLGDSDLRARLKHASTLFNNSEIAAQMLDHSDSFGRVVACRYILTCLGAFRREEPLPDEPPQLVEALQAVDEWHIMQGD